MIRPVTPWRPRNSVPVGERLPPERVSETSSLRRANGVAGRRASGQQSSPASGLAKWNMTFRPWMGVVAVESGPDSASTEAASERPS